MSQSGPIWDALPARAPSPSTPSEPRRLRAAEILPGTRRPPCTALLPVHMRGVSSLCQTAANNFPAAAVAPKLRPAGARPVLL